jgi:probable HAF family extracellular repeat protein
VSPWPWVCRGLRVLRGRLKARWVISDLGGAGRGESWAVDVNAGGAVVGTVVHPGASSAHAFVWVSGKMRDLGTLRLGGNPGTATSSEAVAINDRGQVIGRSYLQMNGPGWHAFLWFKGKMTDLGCGRAPSAGCAVGSIPAALAEGGQVVGAVGDLPESVIRPLQAASWRSGKMQLLSRLPGRTASQAVGVNSRGQVAGTSYVIRNDYFHQNMRAFVWQNGKTRDLGASRSTTAPK